jgi:hypothetical protein
VKKIPSSVLLNILVNMMSITRSMMMQKCQNSKNKIKKQSKCSKGNGSWGKF